MVTPANPNEVRVPEVPEPAKRDFRREVTDRIIHLLETGVAPWQKPWNPADASLAMPMNPTTGKAYRGGNAVHLMASGLLRGYGGSTLDDTQAGSWLRVASPQRAKGAPIEFWEVSER